jgi:uncharacterized radical SAM superfamily Fe-S cluster-containing enzyme
MKFRDYAFHGLTQSLCPECLELLPAKIVVRDRRVYFRKRCPTHGPREDFVCGDVAWFDRYEFSLPGKTPLAFGVDPRRGCPFDCGLCTEHEQHTCLGLLEITSACNLRCPMCFAESGPGGRHLTLAQCRAAIDALVAAEGRPEILQLSGGEPTIHPQFWEILDYACAAPIDIVMINTNGVRIAHDPGFVEGLAARRGRLEVYLQCDGFQDEGTRTLRGESLVETKLRAIERLGEAGVRTILAATVHPGANEEQLGPLVEFGAARSWITGVSFQPACYVGRYVEPDELERRLTFPDVIQGIARQTHGAWRETDFTPLPCAHPNAHTLAYAVRSGERLLPLARFIDLSQQLDLLSGRITFDRQRARQLIETYLARASCGLGEAACAAVAQGLQRAASAWRGGADSLAAPAGAAADQAGLDPLAVEFFQLALAEQLQPENMFRLTTTTFMDAYNFDVRQVMKSCVHQVLPSGHLIPFSAYNLFYRHGRVPLPPLRRAAPPDSAAPDRSLQVASCSTQAS